MGIRIWKEKLMYWLLLMMRCSQLKIGRKLRNWLENLSGKPGNQFIGKQVQKTNELAWNLSQPIPSQSGLES